MVQRQLIHQVELVARALKMLHKKKKLKAIADPSLKRTWRMGMEAKHIQIY